MKRRYIYALAVSIGVGLGLSALPVVEARLPTDPVVRGLRVDGQLFPEGAQPREWLSAREQELQAREVTLIYGDREYPTTLGDLGARIDVPETLRRMEEPGHIGSVMRRFEETNAARRGEVDVDIAYTLDQAVARETVRAHAADLKVDPVDAMLDLEAHAKVPDVSGQRLDEHATASRIAEMVIAGDVHAGQTYRLLTEEVEADVTLRDLEAIEVDKVLATFDTRYHPFKKNRSHNVELATKYLNGLIIRPQQTVSFNSRVGERTGERGFQLAPVIIGDELTPGYGGGTCQVSTTFYGAALYGGLKIVQRRSHSRPSSYTKLGLDATVSWPDLDLKVMNPYNFTLVVHAFTPEPGLLRVELLGGEAVEKVDYRYGISGIEEFVRRITVKSWLEPGRGFRKQKGTRGMDVHSYVTIHYKDGRTEEKSYYSGYRPSPEVYWVAPGYDEGELPELPEHAKGVEGREGEVAEVPPADPYDVSG